MKSKRLNIYRYLLRINPKYYSIFFFMFFFLYFSSFLIQTQLYSQTKNFVSTLSSSQQNDSIYFNYDDYYSYKKLNSGIKLEFRDSLYYMKFNGKSLATLYTYSFKNYNTIDAIFSRKFKYLTIGNRINGNFTTNETLIKPTHNNIYFVPNVGIDIYDFSFNLGLGYMNRKDEVTFSDGYKIISKIGYIKGNSNVDKFSNNSTLQEGDNFDDNPIVFESETGSSSFSSNITIEADNLDTLSNYLVDVNANYYDDFGDELLDYSGFGNYKTESYHYYDSSNRINRVLRNIYRLNNEFKYKVNSDIENITSFSLSQRSKESFILDSLSSSNEQLTLGLGSEANIFSNKLLSIFKIEYIDKDETFVYTDSYNSKNRAQNSTNFGDYSFKLESKNKYFYNRFVELFFDSRYLKYESKSLNENNLNDRDIIQFNLTPGVKYSNIRNRKNIFTIRESFNLSYYHLVNISSVKSNNNYREWVFDNKIDYSSDISKDLRIGGVLNFKSSYHIYDYDSLYVKSFIIKNYTASDTVRYNFTTNFSIKLGLRYTYEEFGRVNWDDFLENPEKFKSFYYTFLSFALSENQKYKFELEYFFYEIDFYSFDRDNYNNYNLESVYIMHGPKFNTKFLLNNFEFNSNFTYNFYRTKRELIFSLGGNYRW